MSLEHIIVDVTLRAQNEWCVLFTCDFVSYGREGKLHPVRDRSYLEVESEMGANVLFDGGIDVSSSMRCVFDFAVGYATRWWCFYRPVLMCRRNHYYSDHRLHGSHPHCCCHAIPNVHQTHTCVTSTPVERTHRRPTHGCTRYSTAIDTPRDHGQVRGDP